MYERKMPVRINDFGSLMSQRNQTEMLNLDLRCRRERRPRGYVIQVRVNQLGRKAIIVPLVHDNIRRDPLRLALDVSKIEKLMGCGVATQEMMSCVSSTSTCARRPRSVPPSAPPGARWLAASAMCGRAADWRAPWSIARSLGSSCVAPIGAIPWPHGAEARLLGSSEPRAARRPRVRRRATRRIRCSGWAWALDRCAVPCVPNLATRIRVQLQNYLSFAVIKSCEVSYRSASVAIRPRQFAEPLHSVKKLR